MGSRSFGPLAAVLLAIACIALAGCGHARSRATPGIELRVVEFDGQPRSLPLRLGDEELEHGRDYHLRAHVELPASMRGQPVDLSVPMFQARVRVSADGRALVAGDEVGGYRVAGPQRWRVPAELTGDGRIELLFTVEHNWTQSAWLTTTPMLLPAGAADPRADAIERVNLYGGWLAVGALAQIGLTSLLVFFLDRRRLPYLWFGIQVLTAVVYPAYNAGLTTWMGPMDLVVVELGLVLALMASICFTHSYYELGPPPRAVLGLLGAGGLIALIIVDPFRATQISARAVVATVVIATLYQLFTLSRLYVREPARRVSVGLLIAAWLALALGTWADMVAWFGISEVFGGVRPASLGLTAYALFLSLLFSRSHIRSLQIGDSLNADLELRLRELGAERARIVSLNADLRVQIADRSAQLFSALSLIEDGDRRRTTLAIGGEVDNRYRVERVLGSGAMGMVYEVTRLSDASRWAMKVATGISGADLARLAREAHIASKLAHANVVSIRDIDISSLGFLYIVLELVEGESLRKRLEQGPLAPVEALPILIQIARGLAAIHAAGVAHRDLKPDNVLLSERDGELLVKIADFGISRLGAGTGSLGMDRELPIDDDDHDDHDHARDDDDPERARKADAPTVVEPLVEPREEPREEADDPDEATVVESVSAGDPAAGSQRSSSLDLTGTGMLAGTPHYVAPELALGAAPNDVRADLYSFGVLAFELLSGQRPFSVAAVLSVRAREQPAVAAQLELDADQRELETLVERCLSFDAERRPTAPELVALLEEMSAS